MEFVSYCCDNSSFYQLGAHIAFVLHPWIVCNIKMRLNYINRPIKLIGLNQRK